MEHTEIKDLINNNNNRSGRMYNEKYLRNHYIDIYDTIINYAIYYDIAGLSFKEKVYRYVNNITEKIVICSNPNCINEVKFKDSTIGYRRYCSNSCVGSDPKIIEQKEKKSYDKFGTRTPGESNEVKEKTIKTNIEKYGSPHPFSIKEINKKILKEYNVENPSQIDFIKNKIKETKLEKYGDEGYNNIDKIKLTNINKYGVECAFQNETIKNKIKKKFLDKYGFKYASQSDVVKNKMKETMLKLYNCENPSQSEYIQKIKRINKTNKTLNKYKDMNIIDVDYDNKIFKFRCEKGHDYNISFDIFQNRKRVKTIICTECNPINSYNISGKQIELFNLIRENYHNDILDNCKDIIKPHEIDIYLPDLKLGIEFNGLYWHNEMFVDKNYHLNKTEECEKQNIKLIHIYEDDWLYKQDIVKSRILNLLGKSNKIFARKCEIRELTDNKLAREFLIQNHLQGFVGSKIKIGLFYQENLVSLMTFGSFRKAMGQKANEGTYEMLRFCNKLNTNVVGGASRLFKYFVNNYQPNEVISYADRSWSAGDLYEKLGFKLVHKTQPNYYYVVNSIRKHRFGFRKDVLIKNGADPNKTEHEIMLEKKIYRIYDSGHLKFIYKKKEE
jgi:hypothetical protein